MGIDLLKRKPGTRNPKSEQCRNHKVNATNGTVGRIKMAFTLLGSSVVVARPEETGTGVHSNYEC